MNESEHFLPVEREIVVTLRLVSKSATAFIGQLAKIGRDGLSFDYTVLHEDLESYIDADCKLSLKKNSDSQAFLEPLSGKIAGDEPAPYSSPFGVPVRRCHVRFSELLPFSTIESLVWLH
jgi:hypothetical protein